MRFHFQRAFMLAVFTSAVCVTLVAQAVPTDPNISQIRSALIPKREVAADVFLKTHPSWDGRGVVIGIFDTGVDPAAAGLATTSTGERKVIDLLDASGSGDTDIRTRRKPDANGKIAGLSGRTLTLPEAVVNPSGEFHLGLKPAAELFYGEVLKRVTDQRTAQRAALASMRMAVRDRSDDALKLKSALAKAPDERSRTERDLIARDAALAALEEDKAAEAPGPLYDCVVWNDGKAWHVLVDTDEDGDLRNEKDLRPFGVAGEYGTFSGIAHTTFGVQVYEQGNLLSIVTVSGDHGTHVASIAAGYSDSEPARNGIAPGARIVSIKIGDIRARGSSYGTSELRASALAAQYRVDIVNVSWGGRSKLQDGRNRNSRVYDMMMERYDMLAVIAAGNNGPALGTAGSAGAEASRVLGVGAYMSPEMGKVLYSTLEQSADAAQQFSSRGPTKDGDFGVDLMAPGAALASVSAETLQSSDMKNGTSMAAPSAAGVAALVLSAARQSKLDANPALLRAALILGTTALPQEEVFTRGSGLINVPGAWKKLNALQGISAFSGFYDLEVDQGSFTSKGRGLMLRETITEPRRRVAVKITPVWTESTSAAARTAFEADLVLKPSAPWVTVPKILHLTNGDRTVSMLVAPPPVPKGAIGTVHVAQVDALLASKPDLGPVFSIPVTIIQPAPDSAFVDRKLETLLTLKPSDTRRLFIKAPADASILRIWVKHQSKDSLARRFSIQAVAYSAQREVASMETVRHLNLVPGAEQSFDLRLKPGSVAEVAYALHFAAVGETVLQTRLEWVGAGVSDSPIVMGANAGWATTELNPLTDRNVKVEAKLDRAVHVFLPESTSALKMDERAELPASALTPGPARTHLLRQRFNLDFKEPLTAHVLEAQDYELEDAVGGGRVTLVHESGEVLFDSMGSSTFTRPGVKFPKGKTTGIREFTAPEPDLLASVTAVPLRLSEALKTPRPLPVRAGLRERLHGKDTTDLRLKGGREEEIYLQDKAIDELAKHEPKPAHFTGEMVLRDAESHVVGKQGILYLAGASPAKVTNVDPKAKPVKDERSEVEKLADAQFDSRLAFVREQRGTTDATTKARRAEVLAALRSERPADAAPAFEQVLDAALVAGLVGDSWPKAKPVADSEAAKDESTDKDKSQQAKEVELAAAKAKVPAATPASVTATPVLAQLDEVRKLANADAVAQYFGAPPATVVGDMAARPALEREKKRMTAQRETLAKIERLRADILRATGQWEAAWKAFAQIKRWEAEPADKQTRAIEAAMLEQNGHLGLALDAVNARLKEEPTDKQLRAKRLALLEKLGWSEIAAREKLRMAQFEHQKKVLGKL
jgi:tripeptidyl-peptidase-2